MQTPEGFQSTRPSTGSDGATADSLRRTARARMGPGEGGFQRVGAEGFASLAHMPDA